MVLIRCHTTFYQCFITMTSLSAMASQITGVSMVCSTVGWGADQIKHQNSASQAFARGIHRWPVNSPHKRPVTWKIFPFDDVIMFTPCRVEGRSHWSRGSARDCRPLGRELKSTTVQDGSQFTLGNPFAYPRINITHPFCYLRGKCSFRLI